MRWSGALCLPSPGGATQSAVLNGRVIRAHYGSKLNSAELKVFIDEAIYLIEAIAPKR